MRPPMPHHLKLSCRLSCLPPLHLQIPPGLLVMGTPLVVGTLFGVRTLAGAGRPLPLHIPVLSWPPRAGV